MPDTSFDARRRVNQQLLKEINSKQKITEANGFSSLVNYSPLCEEPVHRWFRYREGYSIQLVKKLISDLPKGSIILDPFCGCGTSLIAAQELGFESYGLDINPISILVSKVKTRNYSSKDVRLLKSIQSDIKKITRDHPSDTPPALSIIEKVFHPEILDSLLKIRRYYNRIEEENLKDFVQVAWLSILEGVSNVYKEGNGIKYRNRKRFPDGYRTIPNEEWQKKLFPEDKFSFPIARITEQISLMLDDIGNRNKKSPIAHVLECPAEELHTILDKNSVTYSIFSPPYCNCFNYFKIFKVELWMGEFVNSYKDLQSLNRRAIRSHVETTLTRENDISIPFVDEYVQLIDREKLWDNRIPKAVQGYFIDMTKILNSLYRVVKPGGNCTIVVGNSAYSGILIPTDNLLAKISTNIGFDLDKISVARHLTTSSQQKKKLEDRKQYLRESLVIMTKPDQRLEEKKLLTVSEIPINVSHTKDSVFLIKNNGLTKYTHKFHRYPGKFIPHIPRWAINKYLDPNNKATIYDPFCGSGTTLVEGLLQGHDSLGTDIDPIARLVTKVKTTAIEEKSLSDCVNNIQVYIDSHSTGIFKPQIQTLSHWFNDQAVTDLSVIRDAIETYKENSNLYEFLLVCFLSIIRRASNADNQTQKTYVSHTLKKVPEPAKPLFSKALENYSTRLIEFQTSVLNDAKSIIPNINDARNISELWELEGLPKIDLAITSPPYVKSVDYVYNQMAEYFWIGDLFNMEDQPKQNEKKKEYIGSTYVYKSEYSKYYETGITNIDALTRKIFNKDPKHGYIVHKYFDDMRQHFNHIRQILSPRSHYIMVVGDSLVSNEPVMVHELIQDCAEECGFLTENIFGYEIRNRHMRFPRKGRGGIVRYDWVLDFKLKG